MPLALSSSSDGPFARLFLSSHSFFGLHSSPTRIAHERPCWSLAFFLSTAHPSISLTPSSSPLYFSLLRVLVFFSPRGTTPEVSATFQMDIIKESVYDVEMTFRGGNTRAYNVPITIASGTEVRLCNTDYAAAFPRCPLLYLMLLAVMPSFSYCFSYVLVHRCTLYCLCHTMRVLHVLYWSGVPSAASLSYSILSVALCCTLLPLLLTAVDCSA